MSCLLPVSVHSAAPPNIIFILADDLGINDLGCYGRAEHRTPNLDRLAEQGVRFTSAYCAQPICSPSRAAILTGMAPTRLLLTTYLPGRPDCSSQKLLHPMTRQQLPVEEKTLAEHLKAAGYATACIGKWHLGGKGFLPTDQGFDIHRPGKAVTKPTETEGGKGEYELTQVLELKPEKKSLYAKTMAKHWATGADLPDVLFEQWITLTGQTAHVKFRMTYSGTNTHPEIHHELPAVFVESQYDTLLVYQGTNAWSGDAVHRSKPGWPNESRKFTEHWAAYVNADDFGLGVFVPLADELTCYRFGDGKREHGSCSYFAPLKKFAITPGLRFEYDVWLTIGTGAEIRERFQTIAKGMKP